MVDPERQQNPTALLTRIAEHLFETNRAAAHSGTTESGIPYEQLQLAVPHTYTTEFDVTTGTEITPLARLLPYTLVRYQYPGGGGHFEFGRDFEADLAASGRIKEARAQVEKDQRHMRERLYFGDKFPQPTVHSVGRREGETHDSSGRYDINTEGDLELWTRLFIGAEVYNPNTRGILRRAGQADQLVERAVVDAVRRRERRTVGAIVDAVLDYLVGRPDSSSR